MRPRDLAAYAFLALAWGSSFLLLLRVVAAFGWAGAVTFRALIAGAVLVAAGAFAGWRRPTGVAWTGFAVIGATTVAGQLVGLSLATPRIGTAMAAIFIAMVPLLAMAIGLAWGTERIGRRGAGGLCLGAGGVALLVGFPDAATEGEFLFGCAAALGGAAAAAFGSCYAGRRLGGFAPRAVAAGAFLSGGAMTLPLLAVAPVPRLPEAADLAALLALGAVMSALCYALHVRLVAAIGPTRAVSVEFPATAVAVAIGALVLGERLSAAQWLGGAVVVLGCALVLQPSQGSATHSQ
jgi:drug/metabolite transporter (DMT)-like permease